MIALAIIIAVIALLQAADVAITVKALRLGADEVNPLGRWLFGTVGAVPASIALKLLLTAPIAAFAIAYPSWWPVPALYAASLAWVVRHNLKELALQRREGG